MTSSNTCFAIQKQFAYFHIHIHNHPLDIPHLAPSTLQSSQRHILMFLSRFGFSMIKIKRPKLNHKNEINKVDLSETIKTHCSRDVDPGVTSVDRILSRQQVGGRWRMGEGEPSPILFLSRPQPGFQNRVLIGGKENCLMCFQLLLPCHYDQANMVELIWSS